MSQVQELTFASFYREYLALHQNKTCRRLHLLGMAVALVIFIVALFTSYWMWSVLAPVLIYPFAWTGHLVFEKNTPATWRKELLTITAATATPTSMAAPTSRLSKRPAGASCFGMFSNQSNGISHSRSGGPSTYSSSNGTSGTRAFT